MEWDQYPGKWQLWGMPLIFPIAALIIGSLVSGETYIGVVCAFISFLIGLGISIKDFIRMLQSKKRMKNPAYVDKLVQFSIISPEERQHYLNKKYPPLR